MFFQTPEPPYDAVIFTNQRTAGDEGYGDMAEHSLAREQGRKSWYGQFNVRVAKVERAYGMAPQGDPA